MVDDLEAAERRIDEWQDGFEQRAAQARELNARLASLRAGARSDDGLVSVTVGPTGRLVDLRLKEGVRTRPAAETARAILTTLAAAQESLTAQITAATDQTVGADSATGKAVIASFRR
jgi:DNA-binding protein YbaB